MTTNTTTPSRPGTVRGSGPRWATGSTCVTVSRGPDAADELESARAVVRRHVGSVVSEAPPPPNG